MTELERIKQAVSAETTWHCQAVPKGAGILLCLWLIDKDGVELFKPKIGDLQEVCEIMSEAGVTPDPTEEKSL